MKSRGSLMGMLIVMGFVNINSSLAEIQTFKLNCHTQVPHSMCGSGEVSFIQLSDEDYSLTVGDTKCWYGDFHIQGKYISETEEVILGKTIELKRSLGEKSLSIGHLTISPNSKIAWLELSPSVLTTRHHEYNLTCSVLNDL